LLAYLYYLWIPGATCREVGFEVFTAVGTKMAVFWVVVLIALMMEAARSSETLVNFYQTIRRYNPEDSLLLPAEKFIS
jgi:hypothetical protein